METERDIFAIARLRLKEMRIKQECGLIVEGGRAIHIGKEESGEAPKENIPA